MDALIIIRNNGLDSCTDVTIPYFHEIILMKNINPLGLFDTHFLLERLTKLKDPLVTLEAHIDWKMFIPILAAVSISPKTEVMLVDHRSIVS